MTTTTRPTRQDRTCVYCGAVGRAMTIQSGRHGSFSAHYGCTDAKACGARMRVARGEADAPAIDDDNPLG